MPTFLNCMKKNQAKIPEAVYYIKFQIWLLNFNELKKKSIQNLIF